MRAIILAGGKGTRMAPYTTVLPKPLLPVGEHPILEILVKQLSSHGIRDLTFCVGYLGSLIEAYFGNGERLGVRITYSYENEPLGTAGPIANVDVGNEPFVVMNGDLLTSLSFSEMIRFHKKHGKIATIGLSKKEIKIDLGVVEVGTHQSVQQYIEKPTHQYLVSMGIYVFQPEVARLVAGRMDLPDLIMKLKNQGSDVRAFIPECAWLDIGRREDYEEASKLFEKEPENFFRPPPKARN